MALQVPELGKAKDMLNEYEAWSSSDGSVVTSCGCFSRGAPQVMVRLVLKVNMVGSEWLILGDYHGE